MQLTNIEKGQILAYNDMGMTGNAIAIKMKRDPTVVRRFLKRFKERGTADNNHRTTYKRKTSPTTDHHISQLVKRHRTITAKEIQESLPENNISETTIKSRIHEETGFTSHAITDKPFINEKARKARLKWANEHKDWTFADWSKILWTDESPVELRYSGRQLVWRLPNETVAPMATRGKIKHPPKTNVWGCFSASGTGKLYPITGNLDTKGYIEILQTQMIPSANALFPEGDFLLQSDNDPKHTSELAHEFLEKKGIELLPWPSYSPDLNPIENLWQMVEQQTKSRKPSSIPKLITLLQKAWAEIPVEHLENLVKSMPKRCAAVIANNGYAINY